MSVLSMIKYSKRKKINSHATTSCTEFKIKQLHELQHSNKRFETILALNHTTRRYGEETEAYS